jgi:hypothetical protein
LERELSGVHIVVIHRKTEFRDCSLPV